MQKAWRTVAALALLLVAQPALAQMHGVMDRQKQCAATVYPAGNYNPCDPSQCVKVCQCSGRSDCFKTCDRESKILYGPNSCRANIPADKLKR